MPNGKPGDHPVTDIVQYGMRVYSRRIDNLIIEIVSLGGAERIRDLLVRPLWSARERADLAGLQEILRQVRDDLAGPSDPA